MTPGPLGLGSDAGAREPAMAVMTVAWYGFGGQAAGLVCRALNGGGPAGA